MTRQWSSPPPMEIDPSKRYRATLRTTKGEIVIDLFADEAPLAVNNFVFLARQGYYDGVKFHRVIKPFMIQTGDPTGTGRGGPGYRFPDELPPKHPYEPGIVAMANAGPNTNGSQFFICSGPQAAGLNHFPHYTQFGRVVEGMDVVEALASVPVGPAFNGEMSRPLEEIRIESVRISEL
ncbi:peptidylprolyl isomerase [Symbiobacterium thermophilum]|nr:peptidylprolyl isomerase [Symbiobacterium thermophilum]